MLTKLKIDQFVIIDTLDLDLKNGLTILTGETGAGKSILLGAMGLILGENSKSESIRSGSEQSVIEASFAQKEGHPSLEFLRAHDLLGADEKEFHIQRIVKREGREEIRINGKTVDQDTLQKLGLFLVEIHGQFANQGLLEPSNQLNLLDLSGGFDPEVFTNVSTALSDVHRYTQELEDERVFLARHKKIARKIEDVVGRFNKIGMTIGHETFIEELQEQHETLRTAKETSEAFQSVLSRLISSNGVVVSLSAANQTLLAQQNMDEEKVANLKELVASSLKNARDAVEEMGRLSPEYEIDTKPLTECQQKLKVLENIAAEDKVEWSDLYEHFVEVSEKLDRIKNGRKRLKELDELLAKAKRDYIHHAGVLSEKRVEAADALSKAVTNELPPLKLEKAQFEVIVKQNPNMEWTDKGFDEVTFTARMNPGMPFSPIAETASGGELARMMLGLKVIVQRVQTTPTLVFDEVDTGIGGAAAAAVGERIADLAEGTQVLVITHSPQVASRGDQHLRVSKSTDGVTTTSGVRVLSEDERTDEISRMLAGDEITEEAHAAAKRLINEASTAASTRRSESNTESHVSGGE